MKVFELPGGKEVADVDVGEGAVYALRFDGRGKHVIASCSDGAVRAIRVEDQKITVLRDEGPNEYIAQMEFSSDGRTMAGITGGGVTLWDARTWREIRTLDMPAGVAGDLAFSKDGRYLAVVGANDAAVRMWEVSTGKEAVSLGDGLPRQARVTFSRDGRQVICQGADGVLRVFGPKGSLFRSSLRPASDR